MGVLDQEYSKPHIWHTKINKRDNQIENRTCLIQANHVSYIFNHKA